MTARLLLLLLLLPPGLPLDFEIFKAADPLPRTSEPQFNVDMVHQGSEQSWEEAWSHWNTNPKSYTYNLWKRQSWDGRARGRLVTVRNPLKHVSIEPPEPDSCNVTNTVSNTSRRAGCVLAVNGGLFDTHKRQCLGDVVSNGRVLFRGAYRAAARFGITRSGHFVTGFYNLDDPTFNGTEVANSSFVHVVTGSGWLVRNGSSYIDRAAFGPPEFREDIGHRQETGTVNEFVLIKSGRVAIGHDAQGQLLLLVINGQSKVRGVDLFSMADMMIQFGAVNAINLDGGGSAEMVQNGTIVGVPSDHCFKHEDSHPLHRFRCERPVTTVVCVGADAGTCPSNCSYPHGHCLSDGRCQCAAGFTGEACGTPECWAGCPLASQHCDYRHSGQCVCNQGLLGDRCELLGCPGNCSGHGWCNHSAGQCVCNAGFEDADCGVELRSEPEGQQDCGEASDVELSGFVGMALSFLGWSVALNTVLACVVTSVCLGKGTRVVSSSEGEEDKVQVPVKLDLSLESTPTSKDTKHRAGLDSAPTLFTIEEIEDQSPPPRDPYSMYEL